MYTNREVAGAFAGALATLPMTIALDAIRRQLPLHERYALEPRLISDQLLKRAGIRHLSDAERAAIASLLHVGYGSSVGALTNMIRSRPSRSPICNGAVIGLAIWAAGYMGWLPLLGILPPPEKRPRRRTLAIIAAHLVWGISNEYFRQATAESATTRRFKPAAAPQHEYVTRNVSEGRIF